MSSIDNCRSVESQKTYDGCNSDNNNDVDINYSKTKIAQLLNINASTIKQLGSGTYSIVFAINDRQVVKIFRNKSTFRHIYKNSDSFFEPAAFRESFFNGILSHPKIFHYDVVKYDIDIGIYKIGERMQGTIESLIPMFNRDMFIVLLADMLDALTYIHSIGLIHSDVKPANILYRYTSKNKLIFKLCDFNIVQISPCSNSNFIKNDYDIFATPNYCNFRDKRDVSVDIYMLGATLLNMCIGIPCEHEQTYDIDMLKSNHDLIVNKTDQQCYNILEKMLAPQKKRIYIDKIMMMLENNDNMYEHHVNCDTDKETNMYHHELCRDAITHDFFMRDSDGLRELDTIINAYTTYGKTNKDTNIYDFACSILSNILSTKYTIDKDTADFFAQTICLYPNDENMNDWIEDKDHNTLTYKNLNNAALDMCTKNLMVNYHLITCNDCLSEITKIVNPHHYRNKNNNNNNDNNDSGSDSNSNSDYDDNYSNYKLFGNITKPYITVNKKFVPAANNKQSIFSKGNKYLRIDESSNNSNTPTTKLDKSTMKLDKSTMKLDKSTIKLDSATPEHVELSDWDNDDNDKKINKKRKTESTTKPKAKPGPKPRARVRAEPNTKTKTKSKLNTDTRTKAKIKPKNKLKTDRV